jgi:hypothetical protein
MAKNIICFFFIDGSLIVYDVTDADVGSYECVADNGRERKTAAAKFSLRELPVQAAVTPSHPSPLTSPSQSAAQTLPRAALQTASVLLKCFITGPIPGNGSCFVVREISLFVRII